MKCRGCGGEHDPRVRCEVAARVAGIGIARPVVVDVVDVVVDAKGAVVDTRSRDRHRKTEGRREYLRLKQRELRARRGST